MEANPSKRRKLSHSTQEQISETGNSHGLDLAVSGGAVGSNTFNLEAAELLKEVAVDYKTAFPEADDTLHSLKKVIEGIVPHGSLPIHQASSKFEKREGIRIPYPEPRPSKGSSYKVSIEKPSQCNVVGSYVSRTMVKSQKEPLIDMVVEMPPTMFEKKDYLNLRYFYKRAYFLAHLAATIRAWPEAVHVSFQYLNGNPLLPTLSLSPQASKLRPKETTPFLNGKHRSYFGYRVQIIPVAPDGLFDASRLLAWRNCIRGGASEDLEAGLPPTPFYNATLKAEGTFLSYLRILHQAEKTCRGFRAACMLGRVWLEQRGLGSDMSRGGFGHFEWALLVALCLKTNSSQQQLNILSSHSTGTAIFKAVIRLLAIADMRNNPLVFGSLKTGPRTLEEPGPVCYDAMRQLNFAHRMSSWSAWSLRLHAQRTLGLFSLESTDQFSPTFITKADLPLHSFDLVVQLKVSQTHHIGGSEGCDRRGFLQDFCDGLFNDFSTALGNRIRLIQIQLPESSAWDVTGSLPATNSTVIVGFLFEATNMGRQVDRGPSAEDKKETNKFRQFWGEKAELRKFKDGSIVETVTWEKDSPFEICQEILRYVLHRRHGLQEDDMEFFGQAFEPLVPIRPIDNTKFLAARQRFEVLERDFRNLEQLPLQIRQITPIAAELRSTSVRLPVLDTPKVALDPMEVIVYLEASSKWPDNLAAIQRAKMAILIKLGSSLEQTRTGITTHISLEDYQHEVQNLAVLDVIYDDGPAFRLRIHSDLEESILERQIKDKTQDQHVRTRAAHFLAAAKRLYTHLPEQNRRVSTFCNRFPSLSASIRLTKHWFSAQKLSNHFNDEAIELFVLHVFLSPHPWDPPSSPTTGFLRTLLFLSRWDWRAEPLFVNFSSDPEPFSSSDDSDAGATAAATTTPATRLAGWRHVDPNMNHTVLYVATSHDTSGTAYTSAVDTPNGGPAPPKVVATRMTSLARAACRLVREQGLDLDARAVFEPQLREYDVLIHLNHTAVRAALHGDEGAQGARKSAFKNINLARLAHAEARERPSAPVVRHPVAVLLALLREAYAAPLMFFHGGHEDLVIGAVWNPQVQRRSFRVNLPCAFTPVVGGAGEVEADLMEVDRDGILAEIARAGGDLIKKIEKVEKAAA